MNNHTERCIDLPSSRQNRMKIESLLNPPADPVSICTTTPFQQGYPHSPGYWHYQDTIPGATSTATTHASSNSAASMHHYHHMFPPHRRDGSADSSPDPCQPRERYDSVSSSSLTNADRQRPPRPAYTEEEMYFIWYHRVDRRQDWKEVCKNFNRQFPSRQRCGLQAFQCKFYRFIKEKKCPTLHEQRMIRYNTASSGLDLGAPRFGVIERSNTWYSWMREDRETVLRMPREYQAKQQT